MTEAKDVLDKHFMDTITAILPNNPRRDVAPPPARTDEAGNWEHKMKARRPTF